ncbi:PIN domain-containing protein [Micrococcus terreus]|uniref:Predicted nucleic acid-binding protein, contains PIN domain n=1 Tax=Micrococcus terreus TaxID=574650 RepID=A0A1I7MR61_9MICC|nr:PIN domain-containing protein [Micrococcus terreus]SFV24420.1 Predicted nucleic acid-binding protein, contains PIN domain [Micrococcus terreus]
MFTALLDSCVLWPSTLRDSLLSLAFEGSYRFVFSEAILLEVEVNEELKLMDRGSPREESRSRATHLAPQMRLHFGDSIVTGWEGLEGTFSLPDEDDEHVLAAAVVGGAGCIVTENLRDSPRSWFRRVLRSSLQPSSPTRQSHFVQTLGWRPSKPCQQGPVGIMHR